jgi:hypothetical protein
MAHSASWVRPCSGHIWPRKCWLRTLRPWDLLIGHHLCMLGQALGGGHPQNKGRPCSGLPKRSWGEVAPCYSKKLLISENAVHWGLYLAKSIVTEHSKSEKFLLLSRWRNFQVYKVSSEYKVCKNDSRQTQPKRIPGIFYHGTSVGVLRELGIPRFISFNKLLTMNEVINLLLGGRGGGLRIEEESENRPL